MASVVEKIGEKMTTIPITHRIHINKKLSTVSAQLHLTTKGNICEHVGYDEKEAKGENQGARTLHNSWRLLET